MSDRPHGGRDADRPTQAEDSRRLAYTVAFLVLAVLLAVALVSGLAALVALVGSG